MIGHDNLEEFFDPRNYDLEEGDGSAARIAFYRNLALEVGGPVLDVACGTGLVSIPVAQCGLPVTGVDLARPMLDHACSKAERLGLGVSWVHADARRLVLGQRYALILLSGNAFQAFLSRADQEALLQSIRRHLAPGGVFAFETRNPSAHALQTRDEEEHWCDYLDANGQRVSVSGTQRYDPLAQVMHWTTHRRWKAGQRARSRVSRIACRFVYPQELEALLHYNGLAIERQYGSWARAVLGPSSPEIITLCSARHDQSE